ncbi:unnamed protein product [Rotaria socialis]
MINEWNTRTCISDINTKWKKERPTHTTNTNLTIILFNVECLNTHTDDVDLILSKHAPHLCLLTGVGKATEKMPVFPGYTAITQAGTNSFGGKAVMYQKSLNCKVVEKETNFILCEVETTNAHLLIGVVYVPPGTLPPFQIFNKCKNKQFFIFGDFNAKHTTWGCSKNNTSGIHLFDWLEATGNDLILPTSSTSKRSNAIIDFGITDSSQGWRSQVLNEATSDHWPIIFDAPFAIDNSITYKQTNWPVFTFFLSNIHQYWNSLVYNLDIDSFFTLFSTFLNVLQDRCSSYKPIKNYRSPWPPQLIFLARTVNKHRRDYRKYRSQHDLEKLKTWRTIFIAERTAFMEERITQKLEWLSQDNNIWKYTRNTFRPFSPSFKGLNVNQQHITDPNEIVNTLADHYEKHFSAPLPNMSNEIHKQAIEIFENLTHMPQMPLKAIKYDEVLREWLKFAPKKSYDSAGTSAFLLKKLPIEYVATITILFNRCAENGSFFHAGKIAKTICLSKEGMYPPEHKLRPISLLPNLAKWFERIIHSRILQWCHDYNIAVDEQSGFMKGRRLKTRVLALTENLRLTVAACNRPALTIFVDFQSAFDNMWHPALIKNLYDMDMPLPLLK